MTISILSTLIMYFISILLLRSVLDVSYVFDNFAWLWIIGLTLLTWMPFYLFSIIKRFLYPDAIQKINATKSKNAEERKEAPFLI